MVASGLPHTGNKTTQKETQILQT